MQLSIEKNSIKSIKDILCDIPEELQELLFEEFNIYDKEVDDLKNRLHKTRKDLFALQHQVMDKEYCIKLYSKALYHSLMQNKRIMRELEISKNYIKELSSQKEPYYPNDYTMFSSEIPLYMSDNNMNMNELTDNLTFDEVSPLQRQSQEELYLYDNDIHRPVREKNNSTFEYVSDFDSFYV